MGMRPNFDEARDIAAKRADFTQHDGCNGFLPAPDHWFKGSCKYSGNYPPKS